MQGKGKLEKTQRNGSKEPSITPRNNNPRKGGSTDFRGSAIKVGFTTSKNSKI